MTNETTNGSSTEIWEMLERMKELDFLIRSRVTEDTPNTTKETKALTDFYEECAARSNGKIGLAEEPGSDPGAAWDHWLKIFAKERELLDLVVADPECKSKDAADDLNELSKFYASRSKLIDKLWTEDMGGYGILGAFASRKTT
jgi:hypothetical protein